MKGIVHAHMEQLAAGVKRLLPPSLAPLFDAGFTRSHVLFDEYVVRLTAQVFRASGLEAAIAHWSGVDDVVARAGLDPRVSRVPVDWILRHLAARRLIERDDALPRPRFRCSRPISADDPGAILAEQRVHEPACLPSYALAETAAREYPEFLRGKRSGDEILFSPTRLSLWTNYFSNDNTLYAVNNRVGAVALEGWMAPGPTEILELGGGLGSGAVAVLNHLTEVGRLGELRGYRFTELVPAFLRRAQRLQERFPGLQSLTFAPLDMNRPFGEQGVAPRSVSIVYAVNTLHVAHDLAATLAEVRRTLAPGGQLVVSECLRPLPGQTLYPEFVFNLLETFRAPRLDPDQRPNGGFLTPTQWTKALVAAGFHDVRVFPDVSRIREVVADFCVGAIGARVSS